MTVIVAICVAVTFAVSIYMLLGRDLKGVAMGVFLLSHAANLSIIAMSGSPVIPSTGELKRPPVLSESVEAQAPLSQIVDPLPQALILTAIVIGFGVMGFLLGLVVVTGRTTQTLEVEVLAEHGQPTPTSHE